MAFTALQFSANALYQGVNKTAHGFTTPGLVVRFDGTNFVLADSSNASHAQIVGMISDIPDANSFYITQEGFVSGLTTAPAEGGPYVPGTLYYLATNANAGLLTSTPPSGGGDVVIPCFIAYTATSGFFFANPGSSVSSGSGANIHLSNLSATAVNADILPDTDETRSLGGPILTWENIYSQDLLSGANPGGGETLRLMAYNTNTTAYFPFITMTTGNPPTCVLDGSITTVTQAPGTSNTEIATTAFVQAATLSELTSWTRINANQTLVANTRYFVFGGASLTLTMPAAPTQGQFIEVWDTDGSGFVLQFGGAQSAQMGTNSTSAGGTITSIAAGNRISLVCDVGPNHFMADPTFGSFAAT